MWYKVVLLQCYMPSQAHSYARVALPMLHYKQDGILQWSSVTSGSGTSTVSQSTNRTHAIQLVVVSEHCEHCEHCKNAKAGDILSLATDQYNVSLRQ